MIESSSVQARRSAYLPSLAFIAAMPLSLPNIFGATLASAGFGLLALAAVLSFAEDRRIAFLDADNAPIRIVAAWTIAAYFWLMFIAGNGMVAFEFRTAANSFILNAGGCFFAMVVLSDRLRTRLILQATVGLAALVGASGVLTVLIWKIFGSASGLLTMISVGGRPKLEPLYLPLTTTLGLLPGFSGAFPRLVGYAREPGWMALYACVAYFLADYAFRGKVLKLIKLGCILTLVGTLSTAGIGVFVISWTFKWLLLPRAESGQLAGYVRQVSGVAALGLALWLWVVLPGLGLRAKSDLDPYSVSQRQEATLAGWHALSNSPLGGGASDVVGGVNLIAAIASYGLPFSVATVAAIWLPRLRHNAKYRTTAPILAVFLTLLFSQPPQDSLWMTVCVMLIYAATQVPGVPINGRTLSPSPRVLGRARSGAQPGLSTRARQRRRDLPSRVADPR